MDDVEEQKCTPVRASKHADETQKRVSKENSDVDVCVKKEKVSKENETSTNDTIEKSGGKDDFEEQKCKKIRTPKKEKKGKRRSKEKEDIPSNRPGSKDNVEQNERKRSSSEHQLDKGPPSQQTSNAELSTDDQQKVRPKANSNPREKEAPTQEVDENIYAAGRVGIASEDQLVEGQTSATTTTTNLETKSETKTDSKTDKDNSPTDTIASETPSKQAEKPKKKKKVPKEVKEVKDENNAVGQIIADDEISFDEKKKKKSDNKKINKKENTARRSKKPKNESIDETEAAKPVKLKKVRSLDGSSRGHKALKSQDGSVRAPKKTKKLAKQESRDNLPTKTPSFDTLMELYQRDSNVKKKWKPRSNIQNEQSKRNDYSTVKKTRKDKQDGFFKTMFNKAKTTITAKLNKSDDTFVANPEFHMKMNDVRAEYGSPEDYGPPPEKPVDINFDNNGKLFLNGYPFWCIKDEKPPSSKHYVMTNAMRDLTEGKWSLLPEAPEQKDLDAYHTMDHMIGRDAELFKKNKRILSNTIRSLATLHESRIRKKKENSESSGEHLGDGGRTPKERIMSFVIPKLLIQYNRKNRHEPTHSINFTPGIMKKVRNSQRRRGAATVPPPTPAQLP